MTDFLHITTLVLIIQVYWVVCQNEALVVTNLLNNGNNEEAQRQSKVTLPDFPDIESYSGYFRVSEEKNSHLFFWFFKSERNFATDPVVLCLQGGPGLASLLSVYAESGPLKMTSSGTVELRKETWTKFSSVLYIDSPVGAGFSFGHVLPENMTAITNDLHEGVKQFMRLFPNLRNNEFYLWGESYGGKYVSAFGKVIHQANLIDQSNRINLAGIAIGNGLVDLLYQNKFSAFLLNTGLYSQNLTRDVLQHESEIVQDMRSRNYTNAQANFFYIMRQIQLVADYDTAYSYLEQHSAYVVVEDGIQNHLNSTSMKATLHVGNNNFLWGNMSIMLSLNDYAVSESSSVEYLLGHIKVLFYNGQYDMVIPYVSTVNLLKHLNFDGAQIYTSAPRQIWNLNGYVAGYVTRANRLTEILVRNAGHMVPYDQPLVAFKMMKKFIENRNF